jgi:putative ABC transport system permease protein
MTLRRSRELAEEIQSHIDERTSELTEQGVPEKEARERARREFGNPTLFLETSREVWSSKWLEQLLQDLRYALRTFKGSPAFTIVAVLALALGIGATTAIFSVVDRVMLRPLPYPEPDRLVSIGVNGYVIAHTDYFDWREHNHVFEDMTMTRGAGPHTLTSLAEPAQIRSAGVTASFFHTFRVQPILGRAFTEAEDKPGAPKVILLTYDSWQTRFGGAPDILGKSLTLDDAPHTVIGIMAPSFRFPSATVEAITPLAFNAATQATYFVQATARLKDGVTVGQAAAEIGSFFEHSAPIRTIDGQKPKVSVIRLQDRQVANVRLAMFALLGAVGCVLLIACANVANLLLSRSAARQRELAMRAALGAGRMRLVRQLLTESVLLGLTGGAVGTLLAALALKSIVHLAPTVPRIEEVAVDWRVLAFTLAVSLAVSLLFGLAPAFSAARADLNDALKGGSPASTTKNRALRNMLVTAELALSLVLLAGAGLLIRTLWTLEHIHTGLVTEHVLTTDVYLSRKLYSETQRQAFFANLLDRVSSLPGVVAAGAVDGLPPYMAIGGPLTVGSTPAPGEAADQVSVKHITPDYFAALRIPLLAGRVFTPRDLRAPAVAVISETLARHFFHDQDPIGKLVSSKFLGPPLTVVGIVGDVKNRGIQEAAMPELYVLDEKGNVGVMVIRTTAASQALAGLIREQARALDRNTLLTFSTMTEQIDKEFTSQRFNSILLSAFAAIALFLAAIGVYGVMSYLVSLRRREIGIRMALGARTGQALGLVLGHAIRLALAGIVTGLALSMLLTRYLKTLLYGVTATDPWTLCSVALLLAAVALLASYFPARRASRVDPSTALRCQ